MALASRLQEIKAGAATRIPAESRAIMLQATEQLLHSGILDGVLTTGQPAPDFHLEDPEGATWTMHRALDRGPLILTFFRGSW